MFILFIIFVVQHNHQNFRAYIPRLFRIFFLLILLRGGELERKWKGKSAQEIFLEKRWIEVVLDDEDDGKKSNRRERAGRADRQTDTLLQCSISTDPLFFFQK